VGSDNQAAAPRVVLGEDDTLVLHTVGIDIGSATSQIVFSDLTLERRGNRYETVDRTVTYASDILLTPFISDETVDSDSLAAFFEEQYAKAGVSPDDLGAVHPWGRSESRIKLFLAWAIFEAGTNPSLYRS